MNSILLQRATLKNLKKIEEIEKVASSRTYAARVKENEIKKFIKNDVVFLIKKDNDIVGLTSYEITNKKTAHINGLVVQPKFRRKGFAK